MQKNLSIAGNPLTLRGVTYATGIGTHAASTIVYNLAGNYTTFISDIGIDGEELGKGTGSVDFQVIGDGKVLFDSGVLTNASATVTASVNVTGVQTLTLVATNGVAGSIDYDHADWAGDIEADWSARAACRTGQPQRRRRQRRVCSSRLDRKLRRRINGFIIRCSVQPTQRTSPPCRSPRSPATSTQYTDNTVAAGTTYTYRVIAVNSAGNSPASAAAATTTPSGSAIVTNLSSLIWTSATAGWNTVQKNTTITGNTLSLRGTTYASGLGTHASSTIIYYNLAGGYTTFISDVGVDDEELGKGPGSVDFQVIGDGKVLFDSGVLTNGSSIVSLNVNVIGVQTLTLVATNGVADSIDYDHADWAGARGCLSNPRPAPARLRPTWQPWRFSSTSQINLSWTASAGNLQAPPRPATSCSRSTDGTSNFNTQVATLAAGVTTYNDTIGLPPAQPTPIACWRAMPSEVPLRLPTATATAGDGAVVTNLSTLPWASATAGWGSTQVNTTVVGNAITLRGQTYASGIGTHAASQIVYNLNGAYTNFISDVGIDDEEAGKGGGAVDFQVIGDGKILFDSGVLTTASPIVSLNVNVTGVQTLTHWRRPMGSPTTPSTTTMPTGPGPDWCRRQHRPPPARRCRRQREGPAVRRRVEQPAMIRAATPASPWTGVAYGPSALPGSFAINSGVYTVSGAGTGIGGTSDGLYYAYESAKGNFTITAEIDAAQAGANQAGLMIRDGQAPKAKAVSLLLSGTKASLITRKAKGAKERCDIQSRQLGAPVGTPRPQGQPHHRQREHRRRSLDVDWLNPFGPSQVGAGGIGRHFGKIRPILNTATFSEKVAVTG